jgi:hypothetical protein
MSGGGPIGPPTGHRGGFAEKFGAIQIALQGMESYQGESLQMRTKSQGDRQVGQAGRPEKI